MKSDNVRRTQEFAAEHMRKSEAPGDFHWQMANGYTGRGDYIAADVGQPIEERDL